MGFDQYGNQRIIEVAMQQQPPTVIAAPMNDVQLVALIAAQRPAVAPAEAVAWANEILLEAFRTAPDLHASLRAMQQDLLKQNGAN